MVQSLFQAFAACGKLTCSALMGDQDATLAGNKHTGVTLRLLE